MRRPGLNYSLDFGEPWINGSKGNTIITLNEIETVDGPEGSKQHPGYYGGYLIAESVHQRIRERIIKCVNDCRGFEEPGAAFEMAIGALEAAVKLYDRLMSSGQVGANYREIELLGNMIFAAIQVLSVKPSIEISGIELKRIAERYSGND